MSPLLHTQTIHLHDAGLASRAERARREAPARRDRFPRSGRSRRGFGPVLRPRLA